MKWIFKCGRHKTSKLIQYTGVGVVMPLPNLETNVDSGDPFILKTYGVMIWIFNIWVGVSYVTYTMGLGFL